MTVGVLGPGPVVGTGTRVLLLQGSRLSTRLSNFAAVAAALFRSVANDVDPQLLRSQRKKTREFASVIETLQKSDEESVIDFSELVPRSVWLRGIENLEIPTDLAQRLVSMLESVESGSYDRAALASESRVLEDLAHSFQRVGREKLEKATETTSVS